HTVTFGCKLDLDLGLIRQDIRPRYTYAAGHVRYGDFETDATPFYIDEVGREMRAAFTEGTGLSYQGDPLYSGSSHRMFQEDAGNRSVTPSWRERWQRTLTFP
ncbi:MAG: hypothetical protein J7M39_02115, partial [Anaerolineae bacterium]|nr:hypothetical protein [Anaerolineae bacterium]